MKPSGVVVCVVFAAIALAGTVWIGRYRAETPAILKTESKPAEVGPPISPTGPYPKAVAEETEFNFGTLPVGAEGKHDYIIRNDGDADLVLMARKEDTTCSCTFGELSKDGSIKPGESVTVTLQWKIKVPTEIFRHQAIVRTNDPERKTIELVVNGRVDETLRLFPDRTWTLGEMSSKEPSTATGRLSSKILDKFEIQSATAGRETTQVTYEPMTQEELDAAEVKSGYDITVTVSPEAPLGAYSDSIRIQTSEEVGGEINFQLSGKRLGPLEFISPHYHPEASVVALGEFRASEGKELAISLFVRGLEGELKLEDVKQEFNTLEISLQKDEKFASKSGNQRYFLKIKVPPGDPQNRQRKKSEKVDLFFNHPEAKQVRILVDFLATPEDV